MAIRQIDLTEFFKAIRAFENLPSFLTNPATDNLFSAVLWRGRWCYQS